MGYLCLGLAYPFGATPQAPREGLGYGHEKNVRRKVGPRRVCTPRPLCLSKTCEVSAPFPELRFQQKEASSQGARVGFWGVAPNGNARPKQGNAIKHMLPWGEAPNSGVQGGDPPAGVWGGAPTSPRPHHPMSLSPCYSSNSARSGSSSRGSSVLTGSLSARSFWAASSRRMASILSASSGLSRRYWRAFSRPWPMR